MGLKILAYNSFGLFSPIFEPHDRLSNRNQNQLFGKQLGPLMVLRFVIPLDLHLEVCALNVCNFHVISKFQSYIYRRTRDQST